MLTARKFSDNDRVQTLHENRPWLRWADRIAKAISFRLGFQHLFVPSTYFLIHHPWYRSADIVQIYNNWGGVFDYRFLPQMAREKKVVWQLSDQWLFTGHCCYSYKCERWKNGCGACPQVRGEEALAFDSTARLWRIKKTIFCKTKMTIVSPSHWLERLAQESPLLGGIPIYYLPYGVNTSFFYPRSKQAARESLGLRNEDTVILFGAYSADSKRKGGAELIKAIKQLPPTDNLSLMVFGSKGKFRAGVDSLPVYFTGYVDNDHLLAAIYSAADIYALPTLADNLPNSVLEAMACACPVVAFDAGGVSDAVHHGENGYLAKLADSEDLARGLSELVCDESMRRRMSERSLAIVQEQFSLENEARSFKELYESLLNSR